MLAVVQHQAVFVQGQELRPVSSLAVDRQQGGGIQAVNQHPYLLPDCVTTGVQVLHFSLLTRTRANVLVLYFCKNIQTLI